MSALFGEQLYPTPSHVVRQMVTGLELHNKRTLDPSAGRGDILDYCHSVTRWNGNSKGSNLYAIEIDADLRQVLIGKDYKVIDSDFLRYTGQMYFDYILMNPPFKDGAAHLLKAWEISNGAIIKCLLSTETLRNPYTEERQILKRLVEMYGSTTDMGRPFAKSANPTNVEVVLITLQDTRPKEAFRLDFNPATIGADTFKLHELEENGLAPADIFENYEARHRATVAAFKELLAARQKVSYYLKDLIADSHKTSESLMAESIGKTTPDLAYSDFLDTVTKHSWDSLFRKTKLSSVTTESVRAEVEKMQAAQGTMSFTAGNMRDLFDMLYLNREHIMVKCVLEAFDMLTKYHHENREEVEGWKTNAAYLVGSKFILPYVGSSYGDGLDYRRARDIEDLEKALCFLSGKKFEKINRVWNVYDHKSHYGEWMVSEFFITQLYKKQTMHFKWRDDNLRKEFNALVARHRWGWMPEKVKQGVYR